jgi:hypothetical protein
MTRLSACGMPAAGDSKSLLGNHVPVGVQTGAHFDFIDYRSRFSGQERTAAPGLAADTTNELTIASR